MRNRFERIVHGLRSSVKTLLTLAAVGCAVTVWATPPLGFIVNEILASGLAPGGIRQHIQIGRGGHESSQRSDDRARAWQLQLQVQGDTDYYSQHLVLSAGGYSGWHSHPGLLVGAVKSGQIDFYNQWCQKRTFGPGQVFIENDAVHAIANTGAVDADLSISYLVKHAEPRRRDETAPACAPETGIP